MRQQLENCAFNGHIIKATMMEEIQLEKHHTLEEIAKLSREANNTFPLANASIAFLVIIQ